GIRRMGMPGLCSSRPAAPQRMSPRHIASICAAAWSTLCTGVPFGPMHAYRASLLRFDAAARPVYDEDGLLVVAADDGGRQRVLDAGAYAAVAPRHPQAPVTHWPGRILAPGFVDMHVHFPQTDIIGAPADGLLPWLENYTFPA